MNTRKQADIGLGQAIAYFTSLGCSVSIPLTESQRYDMIIDDGEALFRVEVKTSRSATVQLRTLGGNQSWSGEIKRISSKDCDMVFMYLISTRDAFVFPVAIVEGRSTIRPDIARYAQYKI